MKINTHKYLSIFMLKDKTVVNHVFQKLKIYLMQIQNIGIFAFIPNADKNILKMLNYK